MPDENEKTDAADQASDPSPSGEDQTTPPEGSETPKETTAGEENLSPEETRWKQATFTKLTQDYAEKFRALEETNRRLQERLDQLSSRGNGGETVEETPADPRVEKLLRGSKVVRELSEEVKRLRSANEELSELTVTQAIKSAFPEVVSEMPQFMEWLQHVPGRVEGFKAARMSPKQILAAYREEYPTKTPKKSAVQPKTAPKVEGESRPGGVVRDIRDELRAKGNLRPSFEDVLAASTRKQLGE